MLGVSPSCGTLPAACANMENDASCSISSRRIIRDANRETIFYLLTRAGYSPHFHAAVITTQYFGKYSFPVSAYTTTITRHFPAPAIDKTLPPAAKSPSKPSTTVYTLDNPERKKKSRKCAAITITAQQDERIV